MLSKFVKVFTEIKGSLLMLVTALISLWLGVTNQLSLYIHPRYIVFTVILTAIGVIALVLGTKYGNSEHDDGHESESDFKAAGVAKRFLVLPYLTLAACAFGVVTMLVVRPAALTSATVDQRGLNTANISDTVTKTDITASPLFTSDNYSNLSVKDWSGLMAQSTDAEFLAGKQVNLIGFVTADKKDPNNVFYLSRFVVACCVVDARPIGVPIYDPDWRSRHRVDSWVQVQGQFMANPSSSNSDPAVIKPASIKSVKKPEQPYER